MRQGAVWARLGVLCSLFTFLVLPATAVEVRENTATYAVMGKNVRQLHRQMEKLGPVGEDGRRYHAYTEYLIRWNYRYRATGRSCDLEGIDVELDLKFIYPKWTNQARGSRDLRVKWSEYLKKLVHHEEGHRDLALEAAQAVEAGLRQVSSRETCRQLESALETEGKRVLTEYERRQTQYDLETDHGRAEGVIFR